MKIEQFIIKLKYNTKKKRWWYDYDMKVKITILKIVYSIIFYKRFISIYVKYEEKKMPFLSKKRKYKFYNILMLYILYINLYSIKKN